MSWDLVFWRGRPNATASAVFEALCDGEAVDFIEPVARERIRIAFTAEYADDLEVENNDDSLAIRGRGFELSVKDGDRLLTARCAWGFAGDDDVLGALIRAGRRAGCSAFDPQSGAFWEAPLDGDVSTFDLWADVSDDGDDGS